MFSLQSSVAKTIFWFSLFNYPLNKEELKKWSWRADLEDADGYIEQSGAFFFLSGRENNVYARETNYRHSVRKIRRAVKVVRWLSKIPWIEGIALCNSLGYQNSRDESDIDFFIITKPGSLWLTRLAAVAGLNLFGLRPTKKRSRDTICLSFYITRDSMNLEQLALEGCDPYLIYWVTQLTPLYGRGDVWHDFSEANAWVHKFLPNWLGYSSVRFGWFYKNRPEKGVIMGITDFFDGLAETFQRKRLPKKLSLLAKDKSSAVIVSHTMLKFHANDRRAQYRQKWYDLLEFFDIGA